MIVLSKLRFSYSGKNNSCDQNAFSLFLWRNYDPAIVHRKIFGHPESGVELWSPKGRTWAPPSATPFWNFSANSFHDLFVVIEFEIVLRPTHFFHPT